MNVNRLIVQVVVAAALATAPGTALAQSGYPINDMITVTHSGGGPRCSLVELTLTSTGGHESTSIYATGASLVRGWIEHCGYNEGPCSLLGNSTPEWHNTYNGRPHFVYRLTGTTEATFWVTFTGGSHEGPYQTTPITVPISGGAVASRVDVTNWKSPIDADGTSKTGIYLDCVDGGCNPIANQVVPVSTTLGSLDKSSVTLNSKGSGVVTLTAGTVPGTATVTASAFGIFGSTSVRLKGYTLDVTAEPAELPADGHTPGLVTAVLLDDLGVAVVDENVTISTTLGQVAATPGGSTGSSQVVKTNLLGEAMVILVPPITPGTATIRATYQLRSGSLSVSKETTAEFTGYTLAFEDPVVQYLNVAGKVGGADGQAQLGIISDEGLIATRYGSTRVRTTLRLKYPGSTSTSVAGKTINLTSPEQAALGTAFIAFEQNGSPVSFVVTDANGEATIDIFLKNLWQAAVAAPTKVTVNAELAEDPTVTASLGIDVRDNFAEVLGLYRASSLIGEGPVLSPAVSDWVNLNLSASGLSRFNALAGWPGLQNDVLASGAYGTYPGGNDPFVTHTAPWYQHQTLVFFHQLQWGPVGGAGNADSRWLLNGLDWGPLYVEGGIHTAVVLYPRTGDGSWGSEFDDSALWARVLDPWPTQQPGSSVYTWSQWRDLLADPTLKRAGEGVNVQTSEFIEGQFGGDNGPSSHYPSNKTLTGFVGFYYGYDEDIPDPYDPMNRSNWLATYVNAYHTLFECPVFVTVTDASGQQSGYASPPAAEPLTDQIPETYRTLLKQADGTLVWTFAMPIAPVTITIEAYGDGPMTASVIDPVRGVEWGWQTNVVTGEIGTIDLDPSSTTPPLLSFAGGRTVTATAAPVLRTGVYPARGKATGGTAVSVTGIEVQPGATVTIGGVAATGVQYVHGTALTAVTGKAERVGPVDVVVTNPGAQPVTLAKAFTYETAGNLVDVNADGVSDVVFYRPDTGRWAMTKADGQGGFAATLGQWAAGWTIKPGDFSGDGATDLFFYNVETGAWYVGLNDGQGQYTYLPGSWAAGWAPVVLDLTGDGRADVFVYNTTTGAWYQCVTTGPGTFAYHGGQWSPQWEVVPADLDGDGVGDLFVYNAATGAWYRCVSDGVGGFAYVPGQWSPGWEIVAGDFDGDGVSDLLTYSSATGAWFRCRNTGSAFEYTPGQWSAGWQLHVGDFSGDGRADVLVYNAATGAWYECLSTAAGAFTYHGGQWSAQWQVHAMELNGDGQSDVLVYNVETGAYYQCVTTGPGTFAYTAGQWDAGWTLLTAVGR